MKDLSLKICHTISELHEELSWFRHQNWSIGFVPTMGALHEGHASLFRHSSEQNDVTVASIFVNPTQFNNPEDFQHYPSTLEQDLQCLQANGVDLLFFPQEKMLYPEGYKFRITETDFSKKLCGAHREGHFDGVLTVVLKLLNLVSPHKVYFGEKDYQQLQLIQDMAKDFFLPLQIVPCPTVREADGLAMSSRNLRLNPQEREKAPYFYKAIKNSRSTQEAKSLLQKEGFKVDYVEDLNGRRFGAVHLGAVRLIDNVEL